MPFLSFSERPTRRSCFHFFLSGKVPGKANAEGHSILAISPFILKGVLEDPGLAALFRNLYMGLREHSPNELEWTHFISETCRRHGEYLGRGSPQGAGRRCFPQPIGFPRGLFQDNRPDAPCLHRSSKTKKGGTSRSEIPPSNDPVVIPKLNSFYRGFPRNRPRGANKSGKDGFRIQMLQTRSPTWEKKCPVRFWWGAMGTGVKWGKIPPAGR